MKFHPAYTFLKDLLIFLDERIFQYLAGHVHTMQTSGMLWIQYLSLAGSCLVLGGAVTECPCLNAFSQPDHQLCAVCWCSHYLVSISKTFILDVAQNQVSCSCKHLVEYFFIHCHLPLLSCPVAQHGHQAHERESSKVY